MSNPNHLTSFPDHSFDGEIDVFVRQRLSVVADIHHELLKRLLAQPEVIALDLAEAFEDAGNLFIDISYMISDRHAQHRSLFGSEQT